MQKRLIIFKLFSGVLKPGPGRWGWAFYGYPANTAIPSSTMYAHPLAEGLELELGDGLGAGGVGMVKTA